MIQTSLARSAEGSDSLNQDLSQMKQDATKLNSGLSQMQQKDDSEVKVIAYLATHEAQTKAYLKQVIEDLTKLKPDQLQTQLVGLGFSKEQAMTIAKDPEALKKHEDQIINASLVSIKNLYASVSAAPKQKDASTVPDISYLATHENETKAYLKQVIEQLSKLKPEQLQPQLVSLGFSKEQAMMIAKDPEALKKHEDQIINASLKSIKDLYASMSKNAPVMPNQMPGALPNMAAPASVSA